jgi:hypothetical protein
VSQEVVAMACNMHGCMNSNFEETTRIHGNLMGNWLAVKTVHGWDASPSRRHSKLFT